MTAAKPSIEDVMVWPDGSWCCRYELPEMGHKSDDYVTLRHGSPEWEAFFESEDPPCASALPDPPATA